MTIAVGAFVAGYAVHTADHVRMGVGATPALVWIAGISLWALGVYGVVLMARGERQGALYAFVAAAANAFGSLVVHLADSWGGGVYSMPYRGEADALQWAAVASSVLGSALLAGVCARELRRRTIVAR